MRQELVLSLFPGIDLFGMAFEREGFCVVRGPDILYASDIHNWTPVINKFDIIIGGPPCKKFSSIARWTENRNLNLIPEFERVISQAQPLVFVMENVPEAPLPKVDDYAIKDFILNSHDYGANQIRIRRFTFGYRNDGIFQTFPFQPEPPIPKSERTPDPFSTVLASEGKMPTVCAGMKKLGRMLTFSEICELQGVPELVNTWCFRPRGKARRKIYRKEVEYELIGNGVEMKVGRAVARAVDRGLDIILNT